MRHIRLCFHGSALLLAGGLLAGCQSQQALFPFKPVASTTTTQPDRASPVATLPPLGPGRLVEPALPRQSAPRSPTGPARRTLLPRAATAGVTLPRPRRVRRHYARRPAPPRPTAPSFTDRDAYVLFTALALLLGAGGILTLVFLGGWLGITLGVLLILLALFLGLCGGFLGEFGTDKPFSFREFFFGKKQPRP